MNLAANADNEEGGGGSGGGGVLGGGGGGADFREAAASDDDEALAAGLLLMTSGGDIAAAANIASNELGAEVLTRVAAGAAEGFAAAGAEGFAATREAAEKVESVVLALALVVRTERAADGLDAKEDSAPLEEESTLFRGLASGAEAFAKGACTSLLLV